MTPWRLPYITSDLDGIGGVLREEPEDFVVEELPQYAACGSGEHLYLTIEKRGLTTLEAVRRIARALSIKDRLVGYAGLKDARAVTVQTLSVQGVTQDAAERLDLPGIRILRAALHRNKLRKGHLRGNRFRIRVRDVPAEMSARANAVLAALAERGVPNAFGPQRFGSSGNTHLLGRAFLADDPVDFFRELLAGGGDAAGLAAVESLKAGDFKRALEQIPSGRRLERRALQAVLRFGGDLARARDAIDKPLRMLYLSAVQSELFNQVLRARLDRFDQLLEGDLAWLHRNGAVFLVEDPAAEQERCERLEISPSGPLFGEKMSLPAGEPGRIEKDVLEASGVSQALPRFGRSLPGARRSLRVPLGEYHIESASPNSVWIEFTLPPGAYATVVLREVMKS